MTAGRRGRVLYVTYDGLLEPLGASQVLPYLLGLRRAGVEISVLSFEKPEDLADEAGVEALQARLQRAGIGWRRRRYHGRPVLPATAWDVAAGRTVVARWARAEAGPALVHARGYLPALMAGGVGDGDARVLFDMRGFWVDERIEDGHWAPGGLHARVGRAVERSALGAADHLVLLTHRSAGRVGELLPGAGSIPATVVPTCVDTERFRLPEDPSAARRALGLGEGPVLIHTGTLTGRYDGRGTLAVARAFLRRTGGRLVILTRQVEQARALAAEAEVPARIETVPSAEVPDWLQAADAGLALMRTSSSKDASYPTKIGEYLATGLAVLTTPAGDLRTLADGRVVGLMEADDSPEEGAAWLEEAVSREDRASLARTLAMEELSVKEGVARLLEAYASLGVVPGPAR